MSSGHFELLAINRSYYATHADEYFLKTGEHLLGGVYEPFLKRLPPGARVLDAGCGSGRDSLFFAERGFRVRAIDASPEMVRMAVSRGVDARVLTFQEMNFASEFDGIWACASLLHVPHAEIPDALRRFHAALRSEGALYVSLKEGTGERIEAEGRFFSYFTLPEFTAVLERDELFRVVEAWPALDKESSGAERTWLNFLAEKK